VILALKGHDIPVMPLPGGTLNRLCHRVHGHADLQKTLSRIDHARPRWLSGGLANEHPFFVACGFGVWMGFEQVREMVRQAGPHYGFLPALQALRALWPKLFKGGLHLEGHAEGGDVVIAAPGRVDAAFGFGGPDARRMSKPSTLEVAHARLAGPLSAVKLGAGVLSNSWRDLPNVTCRSVQRASIANTPSSFGEDMIGLVDGELAHFGQQVVLTYQERAALVLRG
jgi:diacylglycerol kinase family enzyme